MLKIQFFDQSLLSLKEAKFAFEKRQMVKELQKHGIMSLLTAPQKLTANTINKYLELKERQVV